MSSCFRKRISPFLVTLLVPLSVAKAGGDASPGRIDHWALEPIQRPEVPVSQPQANRIRNPIDAFVAVRQDAAGLRFSRDASPEVLLRRLHLDLTGLPPTPDEAASFLEGWKADPEAAYSARVDALLESPHFGERWARHWLDLARYADSEGYLGDAVRPWAWVYRDWVIDAINRDQPFDEFSIEQLAGDLLPDPTLSQRVATGFHRNTLRNTEAGVDLELYRTKEVVDRVNTTGTVWLGLTLGCAECHDHKHDPLTQRDFFRLYAFFNNADESSASLPMTPELEAYARSQLSDKDRKKDPPPKPVARARVFRERSPGKERRSFIHVRGDYRNEGEDVSPGTPEILPALSIRGERPDRLDLAHWLFDEENPLTARVAANRTWQQLFGVGLVSTSDDFGTEGATPTHPELLDWLATEYRRLGWSRKALIRQVVHSTTYRQSSTVRPELADHPTGNTLLWRQNSLRVSAESIRDLHLAASGLLTREIGGPGIRPPLPEFVTEVGRTVKWPVSEGPERYRRGLYIFLKRTVLYPMLTTFDAPDTSLSCSRREETNTPMQALTLLNDPVFYECAVTLGSQLHERHGEDTGAALDELFIRCLNREPRISERASLEAAHADFLELTGTPLEAMTATARVVMNLDEFITRD